MKIGSLDNHLILAVENEKDASVLQALIRGKKISKWVKRDLEKEIASLNCVPSIRRVARRD